MIHLGLTGSIGMGKTTTANLFKAEGAQIFDADACVHALYAKGGAAVPIIRAGIPEAIKNAAIDREALSKALSKDPLLFPVLESFIHPLVESARKAQWEQAELLGKKIFLSDIPLLFETQQDGRFDKIIVVTASLAVQRERVLARPNMSASKFKTILARQMSNREKCARADYIIYTDRGMDFAREQVQKIIKDLS